jgi:hypothetical protein
VVDLMTFHKKLDYTSEALRDMNTFVHVGAGLIMEKVKESRSIEIGLDEIILLLEHLVYLNYATHKEEGTETIGGELKTFYTYRIALHGVLFLERGGFEEELKGQKAKIALTKANRKIARANIICILILSALNVYVAWRAGKSSIYDKPLHVVVDSLSRK